MILIFIPEDMEDNGMLRIGDKVPEFETDAYHNGELKKVSISDYRGKWLVMMFYPADFTFVCPTELQEMAENYDKVKEIGGEVLSISTDTMYVHLAWHDSSPAVGKVKFPMLADPSGKISKAFDTYNESNGLSWRATFIIDPEGILKHMEIHDNSIGRSATEIIRRLQAAKFVSENPGLVCPASWKPGEDTMKPGPDLVGKI